MIYHIFEENSEETAKDPNFFFTVPTCDKIFLLDFENDIVQIVGLTDNAHIVQFQEPRTLSLGSGKP